MANFNSDGYIMIDLSDVDVTKSTQNVPGIYSRILNVIDANKLILIVNHKGLTPQAAICNKLLNYYVITTNLYIYKINSNDIVIIEQAGSSSVEVSIIPSLMSGTKIADFAIGSVEGSLYAPEFETEINDNVTASNSTWSSEKINGKLELKADAADVYTKTQVDTALSNKADAADVYTKTQVDTALSNKADAADVYTKSQVDTALSNKADNSTVNALSTKCNNNFDYSANETLIGDYFGIPLYRKYFEIGNLPNNTTKTVKILDYTIRDVIDFRCIAKTTNNQSMVTLPYVSTQAAFNILCDIECTNNETKVNITTQMDRTGMVAFGIIDYLKWSN